MFSLYTHRPKCLENKCQCHSYYFTNLFSPVAQKAAHEKMSDYLEIQIPNKDVKQL